MKIKRADIILSLALLVLSIILAVLLGKTNSNLPKVLRIEKDSKLYGEYDLSIDREIVLEDKNHYNKIIIKNGKATMYEANCPDQICVHMHDISKSGETIICLPNKVFLEIVDKNPKNQPEIDKVVR